MAAAEEAIVGLVRNRKLDHLVITGMSFSSGSRYMTSTEKSRTIIDIDPRTSLPADQNKEKDKMIAGLGIDRVSVADMGEDTITSAALAIIKLALLYKVNLDDVTSLTFATESPEDISKDHAIPTIKAVNEMAKVLKRNGYNLGYLNPQDAPHVQSACVAGVSNLSEKARIGIRGKTIIVTSDEARYQLGSFADETGGFGSTALLLEEREESGNRGLVVSSEQIGHARKSVVDFSKPLPRVCDEESGVGLINRYPIVFGTFSELCYKYGTIKSTKGAFSVNGEPLANWRMFVEGYRISAHAPYPRMYEKALVDVIKEWAKHDPELMERMKRETGREIPYLDGFRDQAGQMGFILDIVNNSVKLDRIIAQIDRLAEGGQKRKLSREVRANLNFIAESIVTKFEEIKEKYSLSEELLDLMDATQKKLVESSRNSKCVEDLKKSFEGMLYYIQEFEKQDEAYTKTLKGTQVFAEFMTKLKVAEATSLSKEMGNIYTGSAFLSLESNVINIADEIVEGKKIVLVGYGSGFEARTLVLDGKGREIEYMRNALIKNREFEFASRRSVTADEYKMIRNVKKVHSSDTIITRYEDFVKVNAPKLLEMARQLDVQNSEIKIRTTSKHM